ncbi:MAG: hypothetical protein ACRDL6_00460 [Solirubrobacterales bacterium]
MSIRLVVTLAGVTLAMGAASCGGELDEVDTRLGAALANVGDGVSPTGTGFGWLEPEAVPGESVAAADALGPGADDVLEKSARIRRTTGFDPASASSAVALSGSYALAVLFRDAEPGRLPRLLREAGAMEHPSGEWTLFDLGEPADGRTRGPLVPFGALVSRIAIGPEGVVLARFEPARAALIAERGTLADESPRLRAAARCLGEVAAARMLLATHTYNRPASPELTAVGLRADGVEVLCAVEGSEEDSERRRAALEEAFAPDGVDELTGRPISEEIASSEISAETDGDLHGVRAEIAPAPGAEPGLLFGALVRGSVLTYLGVPRPVPPGASYDLAP